MPKVKIHCAISKKRTGDDYEELHKWIDNKKGINHRKEKHFYTTKLKDYILKEFGGAEAVSEWLFHIALDNLDTYITNEWEYNKNTNNFLKFAFRENGFIHCDEYDVDEENLEEEFEEE